MINLIDRDQAMRVIDTRKPKGLFLLPESDGTFTSIDNETGDAWTENFSNKEAAEHWLNERFDEDNEE